MSRIRAASAPGKMMVVGEYAVLEGSEAIVAAVDRRCYARLGDDVIRRDTPREVTATAALVRRALGQQPVAEMITLDASELRQDGRKLGLGSSAAAAVSTAGALFADAGFDLTDPDVRARVLDCALEGHRAVAPEGSGADVAAAALGGFVRFRKLGDGVETHALAWPTALATCVVWTGIEVRTSDMLARVSALRERDPAAHRSLLAALADRADAVVSALLDTDLAGVVAGVDEYAVAMGALGQASGADIIDDTTSRIRALAARSGGAAKPSGAGGGDVVLGVFPGEAAAEDFASACATAGLKLLSVRLGAPGVRPEG